MRRRLTLAAYFAFMASMANAAKADPIMRTMTLTVAPTGAATGPGIPSAVVYTTGNIDLGNLGQNVTLTGPPLGFVGGVIDEVINTTFDLKITFNGVSGSKSYIDITGPLSGACPNPRTPTRSSQNSGSPRNPPHFEVGHRTPAFPRR